MRCLATAFLLLTLCVSPAYSQSRVYRDTNDDGVIDEEDDNDAEEIEKARQKSGVEIRATAPKTDLVRGFYVNIFETLQQGLLTSYLHANGDTYVFYKSAINIGSSLESGKIEVKDGWMRVKYSGAFEEELYMHPHKLGGRDLLLTVSAWKTWNDTKKLEPWGVLVRLDKDGFQKAIAILPKATDVFAPGNSDGAGLKSFKLRSAEKARTEEATP